MAYGSDSCTAFGYASSLQLAIVGFGVLNQAASLKYSGSAVLEVLPRRTGLEKQQILSIRELRGAVLQETSQSSVLRLATCHLS